MGEFDQSSLMRLVDGDISKRRRAGREAESARKFLVASAREALISYKTECLEGRAVAEAGMRESIEPWWRSFHDGVLYERIVTWCELHEKDLFRVGDPVLHFYPRRVIEELGMEESGQEKPFEAFVRSMSQYRDTKYRSLMDKARAHAGSFGENWCGSFYLENTEAGRGLVICRYPDGGGGCGFSIEKYMKRVDFGNVSEVLDSVHPSVFIGFAEQIKKSWVFRVMYGSLKGRVEDI